MANRVRLIVVWLLLTFLIIERVIAQEKEPGVQTEEKCDEIMFNMIMDAIEEVPISHNKTDGFAYYLESSMREFSECTVDLTQGMVYVPDEDVIASVCCQVELMSNSAELCQKSVKDIHTCINMYQEYFRNIRVSLKVQNIRSKFVEARQKSPTEISAKAPMSLRKWVILRQAMRYKKIPDDNLQSVEAE